MADIGPKGLEKIVLTVSGKISLMENGLYQIAYGTNKSAGIKFPGNQEKTYGILPILQEINSIDFCNIIQYSLNKIKLTPENEGIGLKIEQVKNKSKQICDLVDTLTITPDQLQDREVIRNLFESLSDIGKLIDTEVVTVLPQAANLKNYVNNLTGQIRFYSTGQAIVNDLNLIPNYEVQQILKTLQDIKSVCIFFAGIGSVGDLTRVLIPEQIQQLQRILNPASLTPIVIQATRYAEAVNQQAQKLVGYVNILKTVVKVISVVLKTLQVILNFFSLLPLPGMFTTHGTTDTLIKVRQSAESKIDDFIKRVEQIGIILEYIYAFSITVGSVIDQITYQLEILQFNLEACQATNTSPVIRQIEETKGKLLTSKSQLNQFNTNYKKSKNEINTANYNGYIFKIEEEDISDSGIKYKRRRAIAYDSSGVMVLATELTFATDITILYEELRLKLVNSGYISDLGYFIPELEGISSILDIPVTDTEIYKSVGLIGPTELSIQNTAVQKELTSFISSLPGGDALKNKVRLNVSSTVEDLKADIKSGKYDTVTEGSTLTTGGLDRSGGTEINTGENKHQGILPDSIRTALIKVVKESPVTSEAYKVAKSRLERDKLARES